LRGVKSQSGGIVNRRSGVLRRGRTRPLAGKPLLGS